MDYWGQNITELVLDSCQWKAEEACGYSVVSKQLHLFTEVFYDEDDGCSSGDDDLLQSYLALTSQNLLPLLWRHSSLCDFTFRWQNAPYRRHYYQRGTESKFSLNLLVSRSQHISRWFSFPEFSIR